MTARASGQPAARECAEAYLDAVHATCGSPALAAPVAAYQRALQYAAGQPITRADATDLLATHAITRPLYGALFAEPYPFTAQTGPAAAMAPMLAHLDATVDIDLTPLTPLYQQAADRAADVTDHAARQLVICEVYERFFRTALPHIANRHGIVYTPVEVVDFMLRSTDQALRTSHGVGLADPQVRIIDPFAGTGIFPVRLIQSDLIPDKALSGVYLHHLHGHEIVPLAWHIARTNIEIAYAERARCYLPYLGIALTDTLNQPACCEPGERIAAAAA